MTLKRGTKSDTSNGFTDTWLVDQEGLPNIQRDLSTKYCKNLFTRFEVGSSGGVKMCCATWLPYTIGNLFDHEVEEIWNSIGAQRLRNQIVTGKWNYCQHKICPHIVGDNLPEKEWVTTTPVNEPLVENGVPRRYFKSGHPVFDWEIDALNNKSLTPYPHPIDILFGTDESCNLYCPSCRASKIQHSEGPEYEKRKYLTEKLMAAVLRIDPKQPVEIWITGSGDPFGSKIYRELLQSLDGSNHPNLIINLQTNGVMLTPKMYDSMHKIHNNLGCLAVSLDAGTKETYENKTRLGGHWDILMKNCDYLNSKARPPKESHGELELSFSFVVQTDNYKEMPEYVRLIKTRFPNTTAGIAFSLILDWSVLTAPIYEEKCVWKVTHPEHQNFLKVLQDPILLDEQINFGNMKYLHEKANQ
jgi:sulfatase maturation enzyme AslB (radical SAM superfamily)